MKPQAVRATQPLMAWRRVAVALAFGLAAVSAGATDVRGRVEGQNAYQSFPFALNGAKVELLDSGGQRVLGSYVTGPDGFYYFRGIAPGSYVLRVNGKRYPLNVKAGPAQDVAPVRMRF